MAFEQEGRIEWAVLAPIPASELEEHVFEYKYRHVIKSMRESCREDTRTWTIVAGAKMHAAAIETAYGSAGGSSELAKVLSKKLGIEIYALGFSGYDDPHDARLGPERAFRPRVGARRGDLRVRGPRARQHRRAQADARK